MIILLHNILLDGDNSLSEMDSKQKHDNSNNSKNNEDNGENNNNNYNDKNEIKIYSNERNETFSEVAKQLNTVEGMISNNSNKKLSSKSLFSSSAQEILFKRMHSISLNKPTSTSTSTSTKKSISISAHSDTTPTHENNDKNDSDKNDLNSEKKNSVKDRLK